MLVQLFIIAKSRFLCLKNTQKRSFALYLFKGYFFERRTLYLTMLFLKKYIIIKISKKKKALQGNAVKLKIILLI